MPVVITNSASDKFKSMVTDPNILPRIEITAGGCNGFEKKFSMDTIVGADDIVINLPNGASVILDWYTYKMLENSTVDYKNSLTGNYFTIDIPEAISQCGCGSSFSL
jgi:iron-sulfur cluster insertion protein